MKIKTKIELFKIALRQAYAKEVKRMNIKRIDKLTRKVQKTKYLLQKANERNRGTNSNDR